LLLFTDKNGQRVSFPTRAPGRTAQLYTVLIKQQHNVAGSSREHPLKLPRIMYEWGPAEERRRVTVGRELLVPITESKNRVCTDWLRPTMQ